MSSPKAFVVFRGELRIARIWGLYVLGSGAVIDGKPVDIPELAVSIYCPDGPVEFPGPRFKSFIVPITDVRSINWECLQRFKNLVDYHWWVSHRVRCNADGYGADVKQFDIERQTVKAIDVTR